MHEYWKTVHAGAIKAARELKVEIIWKGPFKEDNRDGQIAVIEDFINAGVSGIALAPLDDTALRVPVKSAMDAGIPVVIFDSALKGDDYVSFVATDNYKGGQLAGDCLAKRMGGKGNAAMLRYAEGSASTAERERGFLDAIKKFPGIKDISSNRYAGVTSESAFTAGEDLFARFKTPAGVLGIDGLFCPNESTSFGVLRALQGSGYAGKVHYVGFDSAIKQIDGLRKEQMDALVVQNPMRMGYLAVKTLVEHLRGKKVEKRIDTGATLVTHENMDQPQIKELLQPDLTPWLK
jgi:ribose transport system substrate-binding protein